MNEDKIDDLFKSNADYLADQLHRDFDPEAFWQQLRPELAKPKRKVPAWWRASAAVVALALVAGGVWWGQSAEPAVQTRMAVKVVPIPEPRETRTEVPVATDQPDRETLAKVGTPKKSASASSIAQEIVVPGTSPNGSTNPPTLLEEKVLAAAKVPVEENPAEERPDSLSTPAARSPKPRYRIVHRNELNRQKETETKARAQVVLRIGLPATGSGPSPAEPKNPLTISIPN
ncbi:MAG: hypothetical protein KKG00_16390 [Bacteroidetes bacterium]|nr:hypothetical protein [Bacteroidota bacterium]